MPVLPTKPRDSVSLPVFLFVAASYAALGCLGLVLAIPPGYASPVFPAAGFALAAVLRFGAGIIPAIWIGSLCLNFGLATLNGSPTMTALQLAFGIGTGATLQAWIGQRLVWYRSQHQWQRLEHERDMLQFLLFGGVLASLTSATCGVISLMLAGVMQSADIYYAWWTWYVGDALGVLIGAPLAIGLLLRKEFGWLARLKTMVVPVLGMLLFAIAAFVGTSRWESDRHQSTLGDEGNILASALEHRFIAHRETLAALARAIEINPELSLDQFEHFTSVTLRDHEDIFALSFNPYVTLERRQDFERQMARLYPEGKFEITERNAARQLIRARDRSEYVAVGYISPLSGNRPAVGFDINSEPKRRAAIARAQLSRRVAVTEPIRLVQEQQERPGVLILTPAFKQDMPLKRGGEAAELIGFAVAVIKIQEMVEVATQDLLQPGLVISLEDPAAEPAFREVYRSDSHAKGATASPVWQKTLMMADREWLLKLFVTDAYLHQQRSWIPWGVGIVGLMFAALLQMFLLTMTGRTALIKRQVAEQTQQISAKNAALGKSEEQYRSVVESIKEVIFQADAAGQWTFLNPAWTEVSGYAVADSLGKPFTQYVHPDDRLDHQAWFEALLRQESDHVRQEARYLHCGGGFRWVEVFARPMHDTSGQLIGITGTLLDITERHLADEKLRAAMQKAEAASQLKSQFLAMMSHEIRTPMNGILGMAQLLQFPNLSERERLQYVSTILSSGKTLLTLLNDILDLSKVEAGKLELVPIDFNARQLVEEMAALFSEMAASKSLRLEARWHGEPQQCYRGDATRLRQMISNLLSNAIKITEQGQVILDVRPVGCVGQLATLEFAVTDTGMGIPADKLGALFQPFVQLDGSSTRKFGGTGLGLSIVSQLARMMDGEVGVSSEPGKGSRFWFTARVEQLAPAADRNPTLQLAASHDLPERPVQAGEVMVVEDNQTNRLVIEALLRQSGYQVALYADGKQAVDAVEQGSRPVLILMDIQMPVMDGLTATQLIRAQESLSSSARIPIVALTADAFEKDREQCIAIGMDDFLTKPVSLDLLQATLKKWLTAPAGRAAAP